MRSSLLKLAGVAACLASGAALANSGGKALYSGKQGSTCTTCHMGGAAAPTVELSGPASLAAGATGDYTLIIRGGPANMAGFNVAVDDAGATLVAGAGQKLVSGELVHSAPQAFANGEARFAFQLKAPGSGTSVKLFGAGNSTNGNMGSTGDGVAATTLTVQVTGGTPPPTNPPGEPPEGCTSAAASGPPLGMLLVLLAGLRRRRKA